MKKGILSLLLVTAVCICIMLGVLIGRSSSTNLFTVSGQSKTAETQLSTQAESSQRGKLDINTATVSELTDLPGIGATLAERIVAYRDEYGPFSEIEELSNVEGIGEKTFDAISQYITVGGQHENTGS